MGNDRKPETVRVFLLSSQRDRTLGLVEDLEVHLALLRQSGDIELETDAEIPAGDDEEAGFRAAIDRAEVVLFLVSGNLIAQRAAQIKYALERSRATKGLLPTIPVLVREFDWKGTDFGTLKPLPPDEKPVQSWRSQDAAWVEVVRGLRQVLTGVRARRPPPGPMAAAPAAVAQAVPVQATAAQAAPAQAGRMKILFLSASPSDLTRLAVGRELREIREKLLKSPNRDRFELLAEPEVRVTELTGHLLQHRPHLLHFSGHGTRDGAIVMEDPDHADRARAVPPAALHRLLSVLRDNLCCVLLNACFSADHPEQAQAIADTVGFCIGMGDAIGDRAAIGFAAGFYEALAYGRTLRESFELAAVQISLLGLTEDPKLFVGTGRDAEAFRLVSQ